MLVRHARSLAGAAVFVVAGAALPAPVSMSTPAPDSLAGTWQVSRSCAAGCVPSRVATEVVQPRGSNVYSATGSVPLVLYRIGNQVLVHSPRDSALLTIRVPGRLMSGTGVNAQQHTFTTTWRCVKGAAQSAPLTPGIALIPAGKSQPAPVGAARGVC
jgi:hypothetical protein